MTSDEQARAWILEACEANGVPELGSRIKVEWSKRMVAAAGCAYPARNLVRFSLKQWARRPEEDSKQTVIHEACHIIAGPRAGHGPAWQQAMVNAGREPKRCHSAGAATDIVAKCKCKTRNITTRRRNKMLKGERYSCLSCRGELQLVSYGADL